MERRIAKPVSYEGWRRALLQRFPKAVISTMTDERGVVGATATVADHIIATWALMESYTPGPAVPSLQDSEV